MANNTFLTTGMAGILGGPSMAEDEAVSQTHPCYRFHPTLPMVLCENAEEEAALPAGYRDTPYSEEEADAWTAAQPAEGDTHTRRSHR